MKLARFPRLRMAHGPTPLQPMKRPSEALGGPKLSIRRADCTGLAGGGKPCVIPGGGSNPLGALGCARCALELAQPANETGVAFDSLVHAPGSAGTQARLVVGLHGAPKQIPVNGTGERAPQPAQRGDRGAHCGDVGPVCGQPTPGMGAAALPHAIAPVAHCSRGAGAGRAPRTAP